MCFWVAAYKVPLTLNLNRTTLNLDEPGALRPVDRLLDESLRAHPAGVGWHGCNSQAPQTPQIVVVVVVAAAEITSLLGKSKHKDKPFPNTPTTGLGIDFATDTSR